jgi:hypothetical protein
MGDIYYACEGIEGTRDDTEIRVIEDASGQIFVQNIDDEPIEGVRINTNKKSFYLFAFAE